MGKLYAVEYVTLDGVFEEPGWSGPYFNDELGSWQDENLKEADAMLLAAARTKGSRRPGRRWRRQPVTSARR